jgi:hypothetical protein
MISRLLAVVAAILLGTLALADPPTGEPVDLNSIRRDTYDVQLSSKVGAWVVPGTGVDMSDPYTPNVVANSPFAKAGSPTAQPAIGLSNDDVNARRITVTTAFYENTTVEEEASLLAANFRVSYFIGSASAAFKKVEESRRTGKAVYFVFTISGDAAAVPPSQMVWPEGSLAAIENLEDRDLRLRLLASKYGTHFVQSVEYGARLVVRAELRTTDQTRQRELAAKVNLAIGAFSAGGEIDTNTRAALSTSDVSINAELTAAAILPTNQALVMTTLDDVANFFVKFKANEIRVVPGPIAAKVRSYWSTLEKKDAPQLFSDLSPTIRQPATSPFGVPPGTIVAWSPRAGDVVDSSNGRTIIPPDGWLLCDGTKETPDLRDRFLIGTTAIASVLTQTGQESVKPSASVNFAGYRRGEVNYNQEGGRVSDFQMQYGADISPFDLRPPSVYCVYIMRK